MIEKENNTYFDEVYRKWFMKPNVIWLCIGESCQVVNYIFLKCFTHVFFKFIFSAEKNIFPGS